MTPAPQLTENVRVASYLAAQRLVPFPVFRPPGRATAIQVRPEGRDSWATVRGVHNFGAAKVSVKQFVWDLSADMGLPKNLYHNPQPGLLEPYGRITRLALRGGVGFHGTDYEGREAGSLVRLLVHIEIRVLEGSLGPAGMRAVLSRTQPMDPHQAIRLAERPFPLWSWSMRTGKPPWPKVPSPVARLKWYTDLEDGLQAWGRSPDVPVPNGHRFEALGVLRDPRHRHHECYLLYRSLNLDRLLEARFVKWGSRLAEAYSVARAGPLYAADSVRLRGARGVHIRSGVLSSAQVLLNLPSGQLWVAFAPQPQPSARAERDLARGVAKSFTGIRRR